MPRRTLPAVTAMVVAGLWLGVALAAPQSSGVRAPDAAMLQALAAQTKFLQWARSRALPHRARQRLRRQHLAHPDDQDGQGLRRAARRSRRSSRSSRSSRPATDVAAQLGAIEDFINQGFDAIVTIAVSPDGFDRVIRLADKQDVVLVPFDNVLDTDKVMQVNEDQPRWAAVGRVLLDAARQEGRQGPRGPRPARQLGRSRPPRSASARSMEATGKASSTSSRSSATGTTARRRRRRPTRWPCTASSTRMYRAGRLDRARCAR